MPDPAPPPPGPRFLSVYALADELGISEKTVRRLVCDGEIAHVRVGGQVRIARDDLERYIVSHRVPATS